MKTYGDYYIETRRKLKEAGVDAYSLEARLVVAHAAGKTMEKFMAELNLYPAAVIAEKIEELIERRLSGEPVAYVTGSWEFYGLPIIIDNSVLIPRMDTEVLVDTALRLVKERRPVARILDLCAGSGCIACALAKELPGAKIVAADIEPHAVSLCRRNALMNGFGDRITCVDADATKTPPSLIGSFDIIVSNPPYIPTGELAMLDESVREYEPILALDGGEDGLDFYRAIIDCWRGVIRDGGHIVFEVGEEQSEAVQRLLRLASFRDVGCEKDTAGIERVVFARV